MVFLINNFIVMLISIVLIFTTTIFAKRYKLSVAFSFGVMLIGILIINFILQEYPGSHGMGEAEYNIGYRYIFTGIVLFVLSILAHYLNKRKVN